MTTGRYISRASSRYSRDDGMKAKLEELINDAPDEHTRREIQRLIDKMLGCWGGGRPSPFF